jgi:MSHA biogenesis protein MshN
MSLVNKVLADLEARQGLAVNTGNSGSVMAGLSASAEDAGTDRPRPSARLNQLFLIVALAVGAWTLFSEDGMRTQEAVAPVAIAEPIAQPAMPAATPAIAESTAAETNAIAAPTSAGLKLDFSLSPAVAETRTGEETSELPLEISPVETTAADAAIESRELVPSEEPAPIVDTIPPFPVETLAGQAPAAVSMSGEMQRKRSGEQQPGDGAGALVNEAKRLIQIGQIEAANARLEEALKQDPDHVAARSQLAVQWQSQGRLAEARALLEEGLQRQPETVEWIKLAARIMVAQDEDDAAINTLARHPPQVAQDPDYHAFLAALYQRRNRHAEAITAYREVLRYQPGYGVWWMGLAISLEAEQRNPESLQAYRQAINTDRLTAELRDFVEQKIAALSQANP